jgi:hypothetical protein
MPVTETNEAAAQQRDRSPAFPVVALETALQRLAEFEAHFKRIPARPEKVGDAWNIKTKAYADRIAAALRYFGLIEYQGAGKDRSVVISEEGRKYLRTQQEDKKQELVKTAALRPKQIATFWNDWGVNRGADAACLDSLMDKGFSEAGARDFLKVYDATITYAGLSSSDKMVTDLAGPEPGAGAEDEEENSSDQPPPQKKAKIMVGERELTTGLLAKNASFRLIVTGEIGVKEIERLIKKLELDKEILAGPDDEKDEAAN